LVNLDLYCKKYGFTKDKDMVYLNRYLTNEILKTISIDLYTSNPYMLLSRTVKENMYAVIDNRKFTIYDDSKMVFVNLLKESIDDCAIKIYDYSQLIAILSIHNLCYRIFIEK
jgi:hypothetical protein